MLPFLLAYFNLGWGSNPELQLALQRDQLILRFPMIDHHIASLQSVDRLASALREQSMDEEPRHEVYS
jgi:hypothetical protein